MTTEALIKVEQTGPVRRLVLNRPDASNAFNTQMLEQLADAIEAAVSDDEVGAIILAAEGKNFQSGMELSSLDSLEASQPTIDELAETIYSLPHRISRSLHHCPKPTVAALQGAVLTMGCEFSLLCDFRIVTPETYFEEKWVRMGIIPALGGLKILPTLIGHAHAKRMILRGQRVYGLEAVSIGLAMQCVAVDGLRQATQELAAELAALSTSAYGKAKTLMTAGVHQSFEDTLTAGAKAQAELLSSEEFRKRLRRR